MPTTVQKTIGSGRDYSSIQAWEDASPANLVTSDQIWEGLLYPEGAGTNGEWTVSTTIAVGGTTTDSTRYKRLTTASGQSWRNNGTPVLRYDTAKGVAIRATGGYANGNPFSISEGRFQLVGLQIKANGSQPVVRAYANGLIDACVLMTSAYTSGYCVSDSAQSGVVVQNSVLLSNAAWSVSGGASSLSALNCIMRADAAGTATSSSYSSTAICKNSGFFGFSSIGAGFAAGSSYNATDLGSLSGSNNQVSLTISSQFVNSTVGSSLDLTIKAGAGLIDTGTSSGVPTVDALGVARGASYDIGATEYVSGGATYTLTADSGSFALTGQTAGLAFNRTLAAASGSFTLTGQDAGLAFNRVLSAASGSYALAGQDVTLTYTPISGATYTLTAASGSFALTGQDTGLAFNRVLTADTQSYSLSGQTAGLAFNRVLTADTVSYALTGQDVTLTYTSNGFTYTLTAESGSFEVTGQDASLRHTTTAIAGGGGWLPQTRRKSRKQIYEERVKLGILPPPVIKAAAKVAAVAQTVEEFKEERPRYEEMFLKAIKKTEWLPDYTRAIQAQLAIMEAEEEELLLLL